MNFRSCFALAALFIFGAFLLSPALADSIPAAGDSVDNIAPSGNPRAVEITDSNGDTHSLECPEGSLLKKLEKAKGKANCKLTIETNRLDQITQIKCNPRRCCR